MRQKIQTFDRKFEQCGHIFCSSFPSDLDSLFRRNASPSRLIRSSTLIMLTSAVLCLISAIVSVNGQEIIGSSPDTVVGYLGMNTTLFCLLDEEISDCKWTRDEGQSCLFDDDNLKCDEDKTVVFRGKESTGNCSIEITRLRANKHAGTWTCQVRPKSQSGISRITGNPITLRVSKMRKEMTDMDRMVDRISDVVKTVLGQFFQLIDMFRMEKENMANM